MKTTKEASYEIWVNLSALQGISSDQIETAINARFTNRQKMELIRELGRLRRWYSNSLFTDQL